MIHTRTDDGAKHAPTRAPVREAGTDEVNSGQLRAFIERIERIRSEQKNLAEDLKEIYGEARGSGFDAAIIKEVVKIRAQDPDKRSEHETLLELYLSSLSSP